MLSLFLYLIYTASDKAMSLLNFYGSESWACMSELGCQKQKLLLEILFDQARDQTTVQIIMVNALKFTSWSKDIFW